MLFSFPRREWERGKFGGWRGKICNHHVYLQRSILVLPRREIRVVSGMEWEKGGFSSQPAFWQCILSIIFYNSDFFFTIRNPYHLAMERG